MSRDQVLPWSVVLPDEAATSRLARLLAKSALPGDVMALQGSLGAGKTAFARAFIRTLLGNDDAEEVPSPTFTLVQTYDAPQAEIWHFDLYRLRDPEEIWELGFEEALGGTIMLIEWPDRIGTLLPRRRLDLEILPGDSPDARYVKISSVGACDWAVRAHLENFG